MRVLFVGFKGKNNASYQLVQRTGGEKLALTNSFGGLKREIDNVHVDYDRVYMFGIDPRLKKRVRIEPCAMLDGKRLCTRLDISETRILLASRGIDSYIADKPTAYLCNSAYYHMLKKCGGRAIFIHIPPMRYASKELLSDIASAFDLSDTQRDYAANSFSEVMTE